MKFKNSTHMLPGTAHKMKEDSTHMLPGTRQIKGWHSTHMCAFYR